MEYIVTTDILIRIPDNLSKDTAICAVKFVTFNYIGMANIEICDYLNKNVFYNFEAIVTPYCFCSASALSRDMIIRDDIFDKFDKNIDKFKKLIEYFVSIENYYKNNLVSELLYLKFLCLNYEEYFEKKLLKHIIL